MVLYLKHLLKFGLFLEVRFKNGKLKIPKVLQITYLEFSYFIGMDKTNKQNILFVDFDHF